MRNGEDAVARVLSAYKRSNALRCIRENRAIVAMVEASLLHRATAYRSALEHLVVRTPYAQAADAEHSLDILRAEIARYGREAAFITERAPSLAAPL
jgi:hypothetical protein